MTRIYPVRPNAKKTRRGAAAIEFAFVALPFFALILGILEIGILLLVNALVDSATSDASRLIRTGQAQMNDLEVADIRQRFCSNLTVFSQGCDSRTHIDIRVVETFDTEDLPDPLEDGTFDDEALDYQPGMPGDFVLVRIWFEHPVYTPFISQALTRDDDKKVRLQNTLAFRNEPYL